MSSWQIYIVTYSIGCVAAKLFGVFDASWWIVLAPVWAYAVGYGIGYAGSAIYHARRDSL